MKGSGATVGLLCSVAGGRPPREGYSRRQGDSAGKAEPEGTDSKKVSSGHISCSRAAHLSLKGSLMIHLSVTTYLKSVTANLRNGHYMAID